MPVPEAAAGAPVRELRVEPGEHGFLFWPYAEPIATVRPRETVAIHTEDAFGGALTSEEQKPSEVLGPDLNPQTGPIFVDGAEPGDTLTVRIEAIEATRDWAVSCFVPYFGGLTATRWTPLLHEPLPERVYRWALRDGAFHHPRFAVGVPWRPFLGTVGTAPALEAISALAPGDHGGNMDVGDAAPGSTVHLTVRVPGALFSTGDAHGNQGDGELCGLALEISARAVLTFDLIKGREIAWPRIDTGDALKVVSSARPMEDAARIAYAELVGWLADEHGMDRFDAYELLTQVGTLCVGNMVDTLYALVAGIEKRYLPD